MKNVDELVNHKENQQLDNFINENYDVSIIIQILFSILLKNKLNTQNNKPTT